VSTYATDRIKLTKLIKSLEAAKTFVDTEKIINDNVSKLPALTNRLSAALKTSQSGENTFRGIVQKFLEYSNKPQNELSDYDKKAMLIYRNAINAVFAKDGKDITSDANPAKLLMQAHLYQEKLKRQQADAAAASDIKFGVSFGEQARHYVRMDIPGLFGQAGDEKHYQKWKAKLRKADRERLEGYQELGNQLGFDTKRYTLSYNVWHDLEKTWRSKSPEQWINWIYGTDMDPGLRNKILTEYPLGSSELGVHKPNGPRGPYSFEISEPRMELGINKDGYVVPINTRKKPDTTPEWVYNNRNPEDKRGLESLMWRIKNGSTTYYDTLVWDKNVERTYNITVDGNQQTLKNIDKYLTSTGALKDGVKINGWIETRTNAEGKKYKTNHSGDTYEKSDIHPWQLSETIIKNNKGWGIPADPAKIKQAIAPPYEGYGKPKNAEFPLRHGDRLGFTYEGKTFWVGRPAYRRLVEDINAGKIDKTNLKAVVAQLLPSFRIETGRQGTNIAAKREGEGHLLSIPDDVQTRIIKEADKAGWKGVTKSNAKKGTIGFLLALVALIRDKTISKLQEE
jgi:hypothetical protein